MSDSIKVDYVQASSGICNSMHSKRLFFLIIRSIALASLLVMSASSKESKEQEVVYRYNCIYVYNYVAKLSAIHIGSYSVRIKSIILAEIPYI